MAGALRDAGIDATGLTVPGPIVATVLAEAARVGADLIAVGSHSHGAAYDLVVGSVSAALIRESDVPVLVVPGKKRGHGGDGDHGGHGAERGEADGTR